MYVGDTPVVSTVTSLWPQAAAGNVQPWVTAGLPASTTVTKGAAQDKPRSLEASSKCGLELLKKCVDLVLRAVLLWWAWWC